MGLETPQVWAWRPPWMWAWRPPRPDPLTSPLGVGLETCKTFWDTTPGDLLQGMLGYPHWGWVSLSACWDAHTSSGCGPGDPLGVGLETPGYGPGVPPGCGPGDPPWVWTWRPPRPHPSTSLLGVGLETPLARYLPHHEQKD